MFQGSGTVYKLMYVVGFALMMVINLKTNKKYKLKTPVTIIITLITYVAGVVGAMLMSKIYSVIMIRNGFNETASVAIMGAVYFTPLFMSIVSILLKQDWRRVIDMLAPGIFVILAFAKLGCFLHGCCHGLECSFGIKYLNTEMTVFPIQIIEVFLMSLIIAFCFWYAFKSKQYVKGAVYPITSIIYCIIRFFVEYFRYYGYEAQRHIILGMTIWQFCCILFVIVCVIWLAIIHSPKVKQMDTKQMQKEFELENRGQNKAINLRKNKKHKKKK